jgi:hypothetical protein
MILLVLILLLALASILISYSDFACCPVFAVVEVSNSNADQNSDTFNEDIRNDDNYNHHVLVFHTVPTKAISMDKTPLAETTTSSQDQKNFRSYPWLSVTAFLTGSDSSTRSSSGTTDAVAATMDSDSDGLTNIQEVDTYRTNMNKSDSDTDGLSDGKEVNGWVWFAEEQRGCINVTLTNTCQIHNTNPLSPDTDGDRNSDYYEYIVMGSYPTDPDQDKDDIIDGLESGPNSIYHTSFFDADSDNDGLSDGLEIRTLGRDPTISDGPGSDRAGNDASPAEQRRTNDPPIANAIRVVTVKNNPVDIILTGSDSNSDTLHFFIATQPLRGLLSAQMVTGSASAKLTYTPLPNYAGEDSFTFWAYDGKAYSSSPGRVFIHISS